MQLHFHIYVHQRVKTKNLKFRNQACLRIGSKGRLDILQLGMGLGGQGYCCGILFSFASAISPG